MRTQAQSGDAVRLIVTPLQRSAPRKRQVDIRHCRTKDAPCMDTLLHSHLDIETLLREFSRCTASCVSHSGVRYAAPDRSLEVRVGREAHHHCRYRFEFEGDDLGEITVMRGKRFAQRETLRLDHSMRLLLSPLCNALRYWRAIQASYTDPLTDVYNRSFMDEALHREAALAHRHGSALSILVLDIDGFKLINDSRGHAAGDEALRRVAKTIGACLRATDLVARYGGDEFLVILSNTALAGARTLSKLIRRQLETSDADLPPTAQHPAVSIGIAALQPNESQHELFHRADRALYRAKRRGGDRVSVSLGSRTKRADPA